MPNVSQLGRFKCFINGQLAIDNCRANNSECRNTFAEKATWKVFSKSCRNGRIIKNVQNEIDKMLGKKAIFSDQHKPEVILSLILIVSIKTEILGLVIILKKLNIMRKNIFVCFLVLITQ